MRMLSRINTLACLLLVMEILSAPTAFSQSLAFEGFGAKARSLGGAFTALADDYTAIYWNPAGLAWANRSCFGLSLDETYAQSVLRLKNAHGIGGNRPDIESRASFWEFPAGSGAAVFPFGGRWAAGIGVFSSVNTKASWNGQDLSPLTANRPDIRWSSRVSVWTLAPTLAYRLSEHLSIGIALAVNVGRFAFSRYMGNYIAPLCEPPYFQEIDLGQYDESSTGCGIGATVGVLYRPSGRFRIGAIFRSPSVLRFRGQADVEGFPVLSAVMLKPIDRTSDFRKNLEWPVSFSLGLAGRPLDALDLTADIEWILWSNLEAILADYQNADWKSYMNERGNNRMPLFIRDVIRLKFGAEFRLARWALRAGFSTNPSPAPDDTINPFFPSRSTVSMSLGAGLSLSDWRIDGFLEYRTPSPLPDGEVSNPVQPPSTRTIWNFELPGQYENRALSIGLTVSRAF